jgi:hypothetical protein
VLALPVPGQDAPKKTAPPAPQRSPAEEEFAALQMDYQAAQNAYYRPLHEAGTDAERAAIRLDPAANPYHEFRPRFQALADQYPGTPTELDCLVWICTNAVNPPTGFAATLWQLYTAIRLPLQIGLAALFALCILVLVLKFVEWRRKQQFARTTALLQLAFTLVTIELGWQCYVPAGRLRLLLIGLAAVWLAGTVIHVLGVFRTAGTAPDAAPAAGKPKTSWLTTVTGWAGALAPLVWLYGTWRDQPQWNMPWSGPPEVRLAEDRILQNHGREQRLGDALAPLLGAWQVDASFFRRALEVSPHREVQGSLAYCLAEKLRRQGDEDGAGEVLERLRQEYADLPWGKETLGAVAERILEEMHTLVVGKPAPDIEGEDVDGVRFKLSDYRGKVVVLDFWGHW